ncbi:hypothetical protein QEN19_003852 [Hanseniaspora menglaensis]
MPRPTLENTSLVTQQLGFSYEKHISDYLSIINKLVYECSNIFKQHLLKSMDVDKDIITEAIYKLEEKIEAIIDIAISDHESYCMRNIFNLPENTDLRLFRLSSQINYKYISKEKFDSVKNQVQNELHLIKVNTEKVKILKNLMLKMALVISRLDKLLVAYEKLFTLQAMESSSKTTSDFSWLLPTLNKAKEKTIQLQNGALNIVKMTNNPFFVDQLKSVI